MEKNYLTLVLTFIIILLQNSIASALTTLKYDAMLDVPLDDELYHDVYDFLDRMNARKAVTKLLKNTLPYSHAEVAKILVELDRKAKKRQLQLSRVEWRRLEKLLQVFPEDIQVLYSSQKLKGRNFHLFKTRGEKHWFFLDFGIGESALHREEKTAYATLFRPTVSGQIRGDFAFYSDLKVYYLSTTQFKDFPKTETRIWQEPKKSSTAPLTRYYIKVKLPWFDLFFGKDNLHWGPGRHGALLVSKHPLPMNMFKLTAQYHPVKFQAFSAALSSEIDQKYITGHRLELVLWDKLNLGIAETIVYGKRFEAAYLNPVQIYTATETSGRFIEGEKIDSPDNRLISGDLDLRLLKNLEFYGEILIDDFRPFAYGLRSYKNWGSKFGVLFGGYWVDPFSLSDTDLRFEYTFVNQYTYTYKRPINTYTHFDSIIGHQIGTDADDIWINLKHWFTANLVMSLEFELERHGEGDVNKPHEKEEGISDDDEWEFLSGITESKHSISVGASYNLIGRYSVDLKYTRSWFKNADNQAGVNDINSQVLLSGQYRF